ncbi:hypothetical protein E2P86_13185 [Sphingobacterium psychroaquaticum]|uniref:hypothetical protein n=1 Tax=Sphingobacterium psychroaquaticum TaxID=561061 RepID=UPI0010690953|nr:hypothetical protein [Sphingobacterium psychroaquaticum]QBQ42049.1 hypothetical protein E2P86_13185 [Sphingobacterium psychroaquaticum]
MKNILLFVLLSAGVSLKAQVLISKDKAENASVSLSFGNTENKGLVLPYVENKSGITENGTIIFDATDKKVKYLKENSWFDLTMDDTGVVDVSIQTAKTEVAGSKVSVGEATATDGVLVLEESDKAMVLPKVAEPHLNIINPSPGMMVYDTKNKLLCVYNGTVWTFWGAK